MFGRLSASWELALCSWQVLRMNKKLLLFPLLSGLGCILVLISFVVPFVLNPQWLAALNANNGANQPVWTYLVAFAYYFCNYFVIVFFNAALISCALLQFHGETPTLGDGLRAAWSRLPQILAWALVSATVGMLLKAVENVHEKAGQIISAILGTVWTVVTFFVVPVLVVEKVGPFEAVRRSVALLKKTWGEALVGHWGIGLFLLLLLLPGILLAVVGVALLVQAPPALGVAVLVLAALYFILWSAAGSALNGIFLGALYQYAAFGEVPHGFDQDTLEHVFQHKK
jgi:hypothetical protein